MGCERWPIFISWAATLCHSHANPMGNHYWQLLMKQIIPQAFYHLGHVFHAHNIWKFQFWNFDFLESWIGYPTGEWLSMTCYSMHFTQVVHSKQYRSISANYKYNQPFVLSVSASCYTTNSFGHFLFVYLSLSRDWKLLIKHGLKYLPSSTMQALVKHGQASAKQVSIWH